MTTVILDGKIRDWKKMPDAPGVYIVKRRISLQYIGQTHSLRQRFAISHKTHEKRGATSYRLYVCDDRSTRQRIETYLLNRFRPKYNISLFSSTWAHVKHRYYPYIAKRLGLARAATAPTVLYYKMTK